MSQQVFSLIVCIPGEAPVRHDLGQDVVSIGRSPENDIQVLVAEVSVRHGRISRVGESYRFSDVGSTNGTSVNGSPVGEEGIDLSPMDRVFLGTVVPAYFVPSAILDTTPISELVASIEAAPKAATTPVAQPKTAQVAVATAVKAAVPLPGAPGAGASTVKLDQVRAPGTGGPVIRPAASPVAPKQPLAGAPAGGLPKPPGAPSPPSPPSPPGIPAGGAPRSPLPGQPAKLPAAQPGSNPEAPQPLPLKRPLPGATTIPLPKLPPKPGGH